MEVRFSLPSLRSVLVAVGVAILLVVGYSAYEFRAERQLSKAFDRLVAAVEARDWKRVQTLIADDYSDAWQMNRSQAIEVGSELLRHFIVISIRPKDPTFEVAQRSGAVKSKLEISGNGSAIAQAVISEASELNEPITFTWKQETWLPWSWKLTSVSQPEIGFDPSYRF